MNMVVRGLIAAGVSIGVGAAGLPASAGATMAQGNAQRGAVHHAASGNGGPSATSLASVVARLRGAGSPEQLAAALTLPQVKAAIAAGDLAGAAALARAAVTAGPQRTAGLIAGTVRLPDGRPLAGACAVAVGPSGVRVAVTGSDGKYSIAGLPAGGYTVRYLGCSASGHYLPQWYSGAARGWSSALGGAGLTRQSAVTVPVRRGATAALAPVTMRPAGSPAYVAWAMASADSTPAPGASTRPAATHNTGRIAGMVTSTHGKPLSGICIITGPRHGGHFSFTKTNSKGAYLTAPMPPAKYLALFFNCRNPGNFAPQFYKNKSFAKADAVTVTTGKVTRNIDVQLAPGATISGTTTGANPPGTKVAKACVEAAGTGIARIFGGVAISDAQGRYRIENLATGPYLTLFDPGCIHSSVYAPLILTRSIHVVDGHVTRGVNAVLPVGGSVSGTVTAAWNGHPLAGVCVVALDLRTFNGSVARSASDGSYSVTGLLSGNFVVGFAGCGKSSNVVTQYYNDAVSPDSATPVAVTLGSPTTGIDAAMQQGGTASGLVTDTSGRPLANICVLLFAPNQQNIPMGITGADGRFSITGIAPGQYYVEFSCSRRYANEAYGSPADPLTQATVAISSGVVTSGLDAKLQLAGQISGTITDSAGKPIRNSCAFALRAGKATSLSDSGEDGMADKTGRYTIRDLAPGTYKVQLGDCFGGSHASQWYKGRSNVANATVLRVRSGRTITGINARLVTGGTIAGTVTSAATHKPAPGIIVIAISRSGGFNGVQTDRKGEFLLRGLSTGTYTLFYIPLNANLIARSGSRQVRVIQGKASRAPGVTLHVGGIVTGTVLAGNPAKPTANQCVLVTTTDNLLVTIASTGRRGIYRASGLAPGSYDVYFGDPACSFGEPDAAPQWYSGVQSREQATAITVKVGKVLSGIGATLGQDGTLSGTVTDSGAQPIAGICATVYPVSADPAFGGSTPIVAVTAADGAYSVPDVVPGRYKVEFSSGCGATGFKSLWYVNGTSRATASIVKVALGTATTGIDGSLVSG